MITINGKYKIETKHFPNGEVQILAEDPTVFLNPIEHVKYDFDPRTVQDEMIALLLIGRQNRRGYPILTAPYLPYSRMDRFTGNQLATGVLFTSVLSELYATNVQEHHSSHTDVQINQSCLIESIKGIEDNINRGFFDIILPDKGAYDRYIGYIKQSLSFVGSQIGIYYMDKCRDPYTGQVGIIGVRQELASMTGLGTNPILFIDDLCEYGGTIRHSVEYLEKNYPDVKRENISFACWHFSHNGFNKELFDCINKIYMSTSMLKWCYDGEKITLPAAQEFLNKIELFE